MAATTARSLIWLTLAAACAEAATPTQVVVLVDADSRVRAAASSVRLEVTRDAGESLFSREAASPEWPIKLVLAPENGKREASYRVTATALGAGVPVARAALRSGFVAHEARFVMLRLRSGCKVSDSFVPVPAKRLGATGSSAYAVEACDEMPGTGGVAGSAADVTHEPPDAGEDRTDAEAPSDPSGNDASAPSDTGASSNAGAPGSASEPNDLPVAADGGMPEPSKPVTCDAGTWLKPDGKSCWRWRAPAPIESFTPGGGTDVQLAVNAGGTALAAWTQTDGTRTHIASNAFAKGAWLGATYVSTDTRSDSHSARITLDTSGNGFAIWDEHTSPASYSPGSARWSEGKGWTDVRFREMRDTTASTLYGPEFGGSADGYAMEVRGYAAGRGAGLTAVRYDVKTGTASDQVELEWDPAPTGPVGFTEPFTALGPGGTAFTVFGHVHAQGSGRRAWANISTPANPRGAATALDGVAAEGGEATAPSIAVDPAGNAVAVWYRHEAARFVVLANRFVVGLGWTGEAELHAAPSPMTVPIYENPPWWQVAHAAVFDAAGRPCAAWIHADGDRDDAWASCYSGSAWSDAKRIEIEGAGRSSGPKLAADGLGNVIAIWTRSDGKTIHVYTNRFVKDAGWSVARRLDASDADAAGPAVGFDGAGQGFAVWSQFDGSAMRIVSSRFE